MNPPPVRAAVAPPVALGKLLRVWLLLGLQSFGGGAATLYLIRRAVVDEQGWLTEAEFARDFAICHVTPGINQFSLTLLIGRRVAGLSGALVSLLGLVLPSVAITILLTAVYARYRDLPAVQAGLRGVVPATVGLGVLAAWQIARPQLRESRDEGRSSLVFSALLLVGSAAALALWQPPVLVLLLAGGAASAIYQALRARHHPPPAPTP